MYHYLLYLSIIRLYLVHIFVILVKHTCGVFLLLSSILVTVLALETVCNSIVILVFLRRYSVDVKPVIALKTLQCIEHTLSVFFCLWSSAAHWSH